MLTKPQETNFGVISSCSVLFKCFFQLLKAGGSNDVRSIRASAGVQPRVGVQYPWDAVRAKTDFTFSAFAGRPGRRNQSAGKESDVRQSQIAFLDTQGSFAKSMLFLVIINK